MESASKSKKNAVAAANTDDKQADKRKGRTSKAAEESKKASKGKSSASNRRSSQGKGKSMKPKSSRKPTQSTKSTKGDKSEEKKKKSGKEKSDDGVLKPTRTLSSYIFYTKERVPEIKKKNPSMKHTEAMSQAGADWNKLSEAQKKPYEDMNKEDAKRYEKQMAEFKKKGYFTLEDGTKSSDI